MAFAGVDHGQYIQPGHRSEFGAKGAERRCEASDIAALCQVFQRVVHGSFASNSGTTPCAGSSCRHTRTASQPSAQARNARFAPGRAGGAARVVTLILILRQPSVSAVPYIRGVDPGQHSRRQQIVHMLETPGRALKIGFESQLHLGGLGHRGARRVAAHLTGGFPKSNPERRHRQSQCLQGASLVRPRCAAERFRGRITQVSAQPHCSHVRVAGIAERKVLPYVRQRTDEAVPLWSGD